MSSIDDRFRSQAVPITPLPETEAEPETRVTVANKPKGGGLAWELLQTIVLTLAIFLGVRSVVQNFRVEGASMEPTLDTGQYLLINKASYYHVEGTPLDRFLPTTHQGSTDYLFGGLHIPLPEINLNVNSVQIALTVEDVEAAYAELIKKGVPFFLPPMESGGTGRRSASNTRTSSPGQADPIGTLSAGLVGEWVTV